MSRCARCGLEEKQLPLVWAPGVPHAFKACYAGSVLNASHPTAIFVVECRERQIANQAALLRSVTLKLEKAHQLCADDYPKSAAELIEGVLEVLS